MKKYLLLLTLICSTASNATIEELLTSLKLQPGASYVDIQKAQPVEDAAQKAQRLLLHKKASDLKEASDMLLAEFLGATADQLSALEDSKKDTLFNDLKPSIVRKYGTGLYDLFYNASSFFTNNTSAIDDIYEPADHLKKINLTPQLTQQLKDVRDKIQQGYDNLVLNSITEHVNNRLIGTLLLWPIKKLLTYGINKQSIPLVDKKDNNLLMLAAVSTLKEFVLSGMHLYNCTDTGAHFLKKKLQKLPHAEDAQKNDWTYLLSAANDETRPMLLPMLDHIKSLSEKSIE